MCMLSKWSFFLLLAKVIENKPNSMIKKITFYIKADFMIKINTNVLLSSFLVTLLGDHLSRDTYHREPPCGQPKYKPMKRVFSGT